ncbi:HAMP domain-containing sensor histidine kinase [Solitalea canadensis]|uniref:histidine kinase n=1 Tax=Solitalea canadensis (strain ATCC 29591 / DSM 3403 / JCM 21819 / LMG 8368 / NBRC 15130 / NCIMB 12057 / USAM 9D) TaxID=929556 RepID=H8KMI6_SOLCM|nr:ATP-binding protein [Solitalea canadensis]AFD08781.1 PAS domain S-box [Solitalea canadensis DSM 3403]
MKTKTKLTLGIWFLFIVILVMGLTGTHYIYKMGEDAKSILKDNYESIEYAKAMMEQLDELHTADAAKTQTALALFEKYLVLEKKNITEIGEKELAEELSLSAEQLKKNPASTELMLSIREKLFKLSEMNMQALVRKNNVAQKNAQQAVIYISLLLAVCVMICFSFIVNFPGYIANPIRQLTEGIKQIANKRYDQRLHFQAGDEFGELAEAFNSMAKQLDTYENSNLAKILFEKKRIETIINNMQDPIVVLDEANSILFVNPQALAVLGTKDEEVIGKHASDVALSNDLMRTLLSGQFISKELKIYANGKESYFVQEVFDVSNENKKLGKVIVLKNITKFHELDEAKTNFIATISHELKTPISSIKMSVKLLEDDRIGLVNQEQKQLISNIADDTQRLLKITAELLDLAQAETGNIQLSFRKTAPKAIVDYSIDAVKVMAEQKHIKLEVNYQPNLPEINSDMEKTAWVLVNFLSNAIRYSPENETVTITISSEKHNVVFSVKDQGKGIEEKYRTKIFERYFKVPGLDKNQSGTGLGLAISKDFIEAQNGTIWVNSELGEGSMFAFKLPIA